MITLNVPALGLTDFIDYFSISDISLKIKSYKRNLIMPFTHYEDGQCGDEQVRFYVSHAIREIVEELGNCQSQTSKAFDTVRKNSIFSFRWST